MPLTNHMGGGKYTWWSLCNLAHYTSMLSVCITDAAATFAQRLRSKVPFSPLPHQLLEPIHLLTRPTAFAIRGLDLPIILWPMKSISCAFILKWTIGWIYKMGCPYCRFTKWQNGGHTKCNLSSQRPSQAICMFYWRLCGSTWVWYAWLMAGSSQKMDDSLKIWPSSKENSVHK